MNLEVRSSHKILALPVMMWTCFKSLALNIYNFIVAERKILLVTKSGIKTFNLGAFIQVSGCFLILYVGFLFVKSFSYHVYMTKKNQQVAKMQEVNEYFDEEVKGVNVKLQKINQYLSTITGEVEGGIDDHNFNAPVNFKEDDLSQMQKETFDRLKKAETQISLIQNIASKRIERIESAISVAGLSNKISDKLAKNLYDVDNEEDLIKNYKKILENKYEAQGGPLLDDLDSDVIVGDLIISEGNLEDQLENIKFSGEFDYLMTLEKLVEVLPFTKPMKNYYISSGFGHRVDPITKRKAMHRGLDFVGSYHEEVYSPSEGKVILAGNFNDYGKAIVIDHGYGITTRYGHLAKVEVKKGDIVKRGQLIALQGNTGRSTGEHLHYEVRYKKSPLDPYKFIKAGELLYSKTNKKSNVES